MRLRIPFLPLISVLLFSALCAIVAYWALILLSGDPPVAPGAPVTTTSGLQNAERSASLFGPNAAQAPRAAAAAPVNLRVVGVLAATQPQGRAPANSAGVALVSIDGQPARPYAIGDTLPNGMQVKAIRKDAVEFSDQGRVLSAPAPREADTGVLVRGTVGPTGASAAPTASPVSPPPPASAPVPLPAPMPPRANGQERPDQAPPPPAAPSLPQDPANGQPRRSESGD
ncbi:MAG: type II secretion system protein N [Burkholderiaceae bacterium]